MKSEKIREKFFNYFTKKLKHSKVRSSSLVPDDDPSVLFTTAGMQQFKPYFLGELSVKRDYRNRNLTSIQKCFRTSDIDSVGDETHLTFFEMLGNFSIGGYFKEKAIEYAWYFLLKEMKMDKKRLMATVFEGEKDIVKDFKAIKIWQKYLPKSRILAFGRAENWWGPPGKTGPCGPSSEIHYDRTQKACTRGKNCQPNCECGRFTEIWNLVFMEYFLDINGKLKDLPTKNIDTGMGFERLAMILQGKNNVFETDLFDSLVKKIDENKSFDSLKSEVEHSKSLRLIADHFKGSVFLISDGVRFSNKDQGYILRRIFRRLVDQFDDINFNLNELVDEVLKIYSPFYPELEKNKKETIQQLLSERENYTKILKLEVKEVYDKISRKRRAVEKAEKEPSKRKITGFEAFKMYSTYGLTASVIKKKGFVFDEKEFQEEIKKHQELSRAGIEKKFGGVGDLGKKVARQHTATHLLHTALRKILGTHVKQMGSDLTPERLRFDFSHPDKLTDDQKNLIQDLVNEKINEDLPVKYEEITYNQAIKSGALAFFKEKYPEKVKVYSIGDFSEEICAGPHVTTTKEIGKFKIVSEKSSSKGVRRIKAILE